MESNKKGKSKTISYSTEFESIKNAKSREICEAYIFFENLKKANIFNLFCSIFMRHNIDAFKILQSEDLEKLKMIISTIISFYDNKKENTVFLQSFSEQKQITTNDRNTVIKNEDEQAESNKIDEENLNDVMNFINKS